MNNNDILRRIRYIFDLSDSKMISIFSLAAYKASREEISSWLKRDDDDSFVSLKDLHLATFLNGLITDLRGGNNEKKMEPETHLNNNIILRKLKIALNLKDDEILKIMSLARLQMSKHELSAFFRKKNHKNYRQCKDQILRNFLKGLQLKLRPAEKTDLTGFKWNSPSKK